MLPTLLLKADLILVLSPDNTTEAVDIFKLILEVRPKVGGKILSLQAATRLCKLGLLEGKEKAEDSVQILAEIYDSFTEGFGTADLQAAKAVLDKWRG
jgi:hypothetical protein